MKTLSSWKHSRQCTTYIHGVVRSTKFTDEQLEENEFTVRLRTRQYNGHNDLDMLNSELDTRMQEQEMNQSGRSMQRLVKSIVYIHWFDPSEWWVYY